MIYLASPYSHPDPEIREQRYQEALHAVFYHSGSGLAVYSPIVHWHPVALKYDLPKDAAFWANQNRAMLKKATQLVVLNVEGWRQSEGVAQELDWAQEFKIPILFTESK